MDFEFEGRTEEEALENAIKELGITREEIDVEVLDTQKTGFLNLQRRVRIRVRQTDRPTAQAEVRERPRPGQQQTERKPSPPTTGKASDEVEKAVSEFLENVTQRMGYPASARSYYRGDGKLTVDLVSEHSSMIIGKKGKNLDALQVLANVVAGRNDDSTVKVVVDAEDYRRRREESLIQLAQKVGDQVKASGRSRLLGPMNPFERRLIHTTLNDVADLETKSEGEGLYKQVRVIYRRGGSTRREYQDE